MSKTPRVDDREFVLFAAIDLKPSSRVVYASFARQLETELADARAEIERLRQELRDNSTLAARQIVPAEMLVDDLTAEIERKDKLIEQMLEAHELLSEAVRSLDEQISTVHNKIVITDAVSLLRLQNDALLAMRQAEAAIAAAKGEV